MRSLGIAVLLMMCFPFAGKCNHVFGGELTYTHVSGPTYKITLTVYGQCSGGNGFSLLNAAQPLVYIMLNNAKQDSVSLNLEPGSITEITPVCTALQNSTTCTNAASTIEGIKRFVYSKVITLPTLSAGWKFSFQGNLGNSMAGRATLIANITPAGSTFMQLEAELDNSVAPNSSPQFTTIPTPYFCPNMLQEYNQGAVDPNNDSLVFSLAPALPGFGGDPVSYIPPFSPTYPISTTTGSFDLNPISGQMSFTADASMTGLVVNKVEEYRNGVKVGSIIREMSFIIVSSCQNTASTNTAQQVVNAIEVPGNIFNVCEGAASIGFTQVFSDADGDSITLSYTGLPAGAVLNIQNNGSTNPSFELSWNTAGVPAGIYNFFVTAKESNCPISSQQTKSFTIRIVKPIDLSTTLIAPTNCNGMAAVRIDLANGLTPRDITVKDGPNVVATYTDNTGSIVDSLAPGSYVISVVSPLVPCDVVQVSVAILDTGTYPRGPVITDPLVYCIGDPGGQIDAVPDAGATVNWYDLNGNLLPSPPIVNTATPSTAQYLLNQQKGNCPSKLDTITISVSENPEITVLNRTGTVCIGDEIYLQAAGAAEFTWLPEDKIITGRDGRPFIRVLEPFVYQVVGATAAGCKDTVSFAYTEVQPCCTFSYPNVFTPNNDSRNDTWHPILYGNEASYELLIFNRWGNELFRSFTPNEGWNGTKGGVVQETGTYFFYLRAKCLTGKEEVRTGEFYLLK